MENREKLIKKLRKDIKSLQLKTEHTRLYNIRNFAARALIKSGIAIDYALPFILAATVMGNIYALEGDAPFVIDEVTDNALVQTIDTSEGLHIRQTSYDIDYDTRMIEHTTGWIVNDKGLYETTITSYRLNSNIDLSDKEKVLSMTKEEIEEALIITNVKTIQKGSLTEEDSIYYSDAIVITDYFESEEEYFLRPETGKENFGNSFGYILVSLLLGGAFAGVSHIFVKSYIRDELGRNLAKVRPITKEELETLKKMIALKQQNLSLLTDTGNNNENKGIQYSLRK